MNQKVNSFYFFIHQNGPPGNITDHQKHHINTAKFNICIFEDSKTTKDWFFTFAWFNRIAQNIKHP